MMRGVRWYLVGSVILVTLAGCVDCHKGPGVGGTGFRKFGVHTDYRKATGTDNPDKGRFDLTKDPGDIDKSL